MLFTRHSDFRNSFITDHLDICERILTGVRYTITSTPLNLAHPALLKRTLLSLNIACLCYVHGILWLFSLNLKKTLIFRKYRVNKKTGLDTDNSVHVCTLLLNITFNAVLFLLSEVPRPLSFGNRLSQFSSSSPNSTSQSGGKLHRLIHITDEKTKNKPCVYCQFTGVKTKSGWKVYTTYQCEACDIPLCRGSRNCFMLYHKQYVGRNDEPLYETGIL